MRGITRVAFVLMLAPAAAAAQQVSDADLVKMCLDELKARQPAEAAQGQTSVTASSVTRTETQQIVSLKATEAEGRPVSARCVIRNGKVFDFRQ